jgi:hypothetical protein
MQTQAYQREIRFLKGLVPVESAENLYSQLKNSEDWKKEEVKIHQTREKEMKEQQMFAENFFSRDSTWWKKKILNYNLRMTNGKDQSDALMCRRIMSYLSLIAYMNYSRAESAGDKEKSDFSLVVYRIVDPENAAKIK